MVLEGNAPAMEEDAFGSVNSDCTAYVHENSSGWGVPVPGTWNGIKIAYGTGTPSGDGEAGDGSSDDGGKPDDVQSAAEADAMPSGVANEYCGYLVDGDGVVAGTIQVKVGKPNVSTRRATAKAMVQLGARKTSLKAAENGGKVQVAEGGPVEYCFCASTAD